jgi:cation diffusion facilitator family transporter
MAKSGYKKDVQRKMNKAMLISLAVGFLMLFLKVYAYLLTGSSAILSDAAESIVHVFAVAFAAYSMWLSHKPADKEHTYGHDRIAFFSAGLEGALITVAAIFILYQAINKLIFGVELEHLDYGMLFISFATACNAFLGLYLLRLGRKHHSIVLIADGRHILTDCLTSLGIVVALLLTYSTGIILLDPIIAIAVGGNILWTGLKLVRGAIRGLMDEVEPSLDRIVRNLIEEETKKLGIEYHRLRHRNGGNRIIIEIHLLFPQEITLIEAHAISTKLEQNVERACEHPLELVIHLEPRKELLFLTV